VSLRHCVRESPVSVKANDLNYIDINFSPGTRIKDTGNKRFVPLPPTNAEQRSAAMDWTPEEDRQLFIFARQYSFNWDLIASVFNDATHRPQSDARLPWDCYDRWHKKYAPLPTPASVTAATPALPSGAAAATPATAGPVNGQQAPGQMAQQQAQAQAGLAQNKKDKRSGSATLALSAATPNTVRKPDQLSRAQIRHMCIIEATKKAQKKRELQMKNSRSSLPWLV
jgi:chromatin modification-related protein VID21